MRLERDSSVIGVWLEANTTFCWWGDWLAAQLQVAICAAAFWQRKPVMTGVVAAVKVDPL